MFLEDRAEEIMRMQQNAEHTLLPKCNKINNQKQDKNKHKKRLVLNLMCG